VISLIVGIAKVVMVVLVLLSFQWFVLHFVRIAIHVLCAAA